MIDRKLGFTALAGFFISAVLYALRWYNVVNPRQESTYRLFNLLFFFAFVLAFSTSIVFFGRWIFQVTQNMAKGFRWGISIVFSVILFGFESFLFMMGCLGMNFMGQ